MPQVTAGQTASGIVQSLKITPEAFLKSNPTFAAQAGEKNSYLGLTGNIKVGQNYVIPGQEPVVSTTATPGSGTYPEDLTKQKQDQINNKNGGTTPPPAPSLISTSEKLRAEAAQTALDTAKAPTPFSSLETYNKLRTEQGVVQDENEMNAIQTEKAKIQNELNTFKVGSGEGMTESGRLGQVSEKERNANYRLDSLAIQENSVTNRLNSKNAYISNMVNMGNQDYTTAYNAYKDEYNKNLQAIQQYNSDLSKERQDAMTAFTTITNLLKDNNVSYSSISPTLKAQLQSSALQAGLPSDIFDTLAKAAPNAKILAPMEVANDDGSKSIYFFSQDQKTGAPKLLQVFGSNSSSNNILTSPSGINYNMSTYATDPNHTAKVQQIIQSIGKLNTPQDIANYIQQNNPNSPITAQMIQTASQKYGVGWEELLGLLKEESQLGTQGMAVSTNNPGNVGNMDGGQTKKFASWQDGVNAAAGALSSRKTSADPGDLGGAKNQQKLEQQYRDILVKEVSSRSGTVGTEDAKVAQANHLASIFDQYYDSKNGKYNIPVAQYGELVLGLAGMLSKTGTPTDSQIDTINAKTAKGDIAGALQYITGTAQTGNTQDIIKNLKDSIDRQAQVAVKNREAGLNVLRGLAPTDLNPSRRSALEKNTLVPYSGIGKSNNMTLMTGPDGVDYNVPNDQVDSFIKAGGKKK